MEIKETRLYPRKTFNSKGEGKTTSYNMVFPLGAVRDIAELTENDRLEVTYEKNLIKITKKD